jgi:hypothetical protein
VPGPSLDGEAEGSGSRRNVYGVSWLVVRGYRGCNKDPCTSTK